MGKILVTGGSGFIGSHLVEHLLEKDYKVSILDKNKSASKAKFCKGDICKDANKIIIKEKPDICVHLAAQVSVRYALAHPVEDTETNVMGSLQVMQACAEAGVKKFIYISTAARFGEPAKIPLKENTPCKPLSPYGASKYAAEFYLPFFKERYGMDYTILALANVYGPGQDPEGEAGVISIFIDNIQKNKPCKIFGDGKQTRDFVFVKDVAQAIEASFETTAPLLLIGSGTETSVNELFKKLAAILGKGEKTHEEAVPGEIQRAVFDISQAKKELGWNPRTSLEKGLKATLK